jgi:hypothetical protein
VRNVKDLQPKMLSAVVPQFVTIRERGMPVYRVELWDRQNKPAGRHEFTCDSDAEAIAEARNFSAPGLAVLLLQDKRPVTAFGPPKALGR